MYGLHVRFTISTTFYTWYDDKYCILELPSANEFNENFTFPGNAATGEENSKQLWQFFLELLLSGSTYSHLLRWTGSNLEFKIEDPEGLAELWGHLTMKKAVDSNQLYQTLNHYCTKTTVLSRVLEQEATFRFHPNIATYISMHYAQGQSTPASMNSSNDNCKEILVVD